MNVEKIAEGIRNILHYIEGFGAEDRDGLRQTPLRVAKAYRKIFGGYSIKVEDVVTIFDSEGFDEMVLLKDIEFYSTCEHHMLPFFGKAHIAYIPDGKIIGISKLARILDIFARRLQNQERITKQVAEAIEKVLSPKGAAVVLEAEHLCMRARGVQKQNSTMVTSKLTGAFNNSVRTRVEFFNLIKK